MLVLGMVSIKGSGRKCLLIFNLQIAPFGVGSHRHSRDSVATPSAMWGNLPVICGRCGGIIPEKLKICQDPENISGINPIPKKKRITTQSRKGNIIFLLFNFDMKDIKAYFLILGHPFKITLKKKVKRPQKKKCQVHTIHPSIHHAMFSSPETSCVFLLPQRSLASIPPSFAFSPFEGCGNAGNHNAPGFCGWGWQKFQEKKYANTSFYPHSSPPTKKQLEKHNLSLFFESTCQIKKKVEEISGKWNLILKLRRKSVN